VLDWQKSFVRQHRHAHPIAVSIHLHPIQVSYPLDSIDKKHAVQVVDFVVNYHRIKTLKNPVEGSTLLVQARYSQIVRANGLRVKARKTETPVEISFLIAGFNNLWVNQSSGRARLGLVISAPTQSDNHHPAVDVDLGSSQPDALWVIVQGVFQISNQSPNSLVRTLDWSASLAQSSFVFCVQNNVSHSPDLTLSASSMPYSFTIPVHTL
jgi:hypothetical protein